MRERQNPGSSSFKPTIKKQKSLLQLLMDKFSSRTEEVSPADQLAAQLEVVRRAGPSELGGILAAALYAKKTLDTTRQVDIPFPDAVFAGDQAIDETVRAGLVAYAAELEEFQAECIAHDTPLSGAVARGLPTWIVSVHAAASPALMPQACEMWAKLATADDHVEEGYRFLLRRDPSDVERSYFTYRPQLFLR